MSDSYAIVTEIPGDRASQEQLERLSQRYHFARPYCQDKSVLEVACGSGMGLGYLAKTSRYVVGGDIDEDLLTLSVNRYKERKNIQVSTFDAQSRPFSDKSFDVILLFEAIYYLPEPEKFISEAHRILRKDGHLLVCTANKDLADFNPSPFSQKYLGAGELQALIKQEFYQVDVFGGFPVCKQGFKGKIVSGIKRAAVSLHVMPKTMKGKEKFKRIFFGKLTALPSEISEETARYYPPDPILSNKPNSSHKVLFFAAKV